MAFGVGAFIGAVPASSIDYWDPSNAVTKDGAPILYGEGPTFSDNPWEVCFLNGNPTPGLCRVTCEGKVKFDPKKPGGVDGLTITTQGYIPGPVKIEVKIWTQEQWEFWQAIIDAIWVKPGRGGKIKAIDISHPATDSLKIKAIVVEGVSVPEDGPEPQTKIVRIQAVEFLPPTKSATKTIRSSGKVPVDKRVDRSKNAGGESPGKTDTGPRGAKKERAPGTT